ncbi:hypothetical protein ACS0TY_019820 [Phlomoides rotata]
MMMIMENFLKLLVTNGEASKRTIHTILAIITALLAEMGPPRSKNIGYVIDVGTLGLLVWWLVEFGACCLILNLVLHAMHHFLMFCRIGSGCNVLENGEH